MRGNFHFSLREIAEKISCCEISPLELAESYLDNIEKNDKQIQAWSYLDIGGAIETAAKLAKEAQMGQIRSPLHGIPIGIKDNIDTIGMPTHMGSKLSALRIPAEIDAPIVEKLKKMGAVIIGKTNMTEFAWLDPGPTRNPKNLEHTPGGSSSGSAAAVSAGMVPIALGSQTAASVCRPAAYCGAAAFKPTYLPNKDIHPLAPSFDTIGFFGGQFDNLAFFLKSFDEKYLISHSIKSNLKIGFIADSIYKEASRSLLDLQGHVLQNVKSTAQIEEVKPIIPFQQIIEWHKKVVAYEAADTYKELIRNQSSIISRNFSQLIHDGLAISRQEYSELLERITGVKEQFWIENNHIDMFVTIPTSASAPKGLDNTGDPSFTIPWTVLGGPLSVIPSGTDEQGLPISIMLASSPNSDKKLLSLSSYVNGYIN